MKRNLSVPDPQVCTCTICDELKASGEIWFLLTESFCADKLRILEWHDEVATRAGVYRACSPGHVEELVIHWMTTGSLNFPFATSATPPIRVGPRMTIASLPLLAEPDTRGARQVSELAVHRPSVERLLRESPDALQLILDELTRTLQRESVGDTRFNPTDSAASGVLRPA